MSTHPSHTFWLSFSSMSRKKEQSINRAGIVQEDIQPPGILDSRVSIDRFKGLPEKSLTAAAGENPIGLMPCPNYAHQLIRQCRTCFPRRW
ncbi:small integral membrane protein 20 isoform X2 [Anas platyrhynchos]|uniref:small integral membrane protein 20 isoform X2 n=1 Tax=Anas platyrhynchos TaxID=8839 RepID=UPI003AF2A287